MRTTLRGLPVLSSMVRHKPSGESLAFVCAATPPAAPNIQAAASTDAIGDGKVFVLDLASATRIRTGETGDTAL